MKKTISSKKQILLTMMIFVIPLIGALVGYNFYNLNMLNQRIAQTDRNAIYLYQHSIEQKLELAEGYMANFLANDSDCLQLRYTRSKLKAHVLSYNIQEKYRTMMNTEPALAALFLYSRENQVFRPVYNRGYSFEIKNEAERFMKSTVEESPDCVKRGWFLHKVGETPFVFRFLGTNGIYSVCVVDLNNVEVPQFFGENQAESYLFFRDLDGVAVTEQEWLEENRISLRTDQPEYYFSGAGQKQFLLVENRMEKIGLWVVHASPYSRWFMSMDIVQMIIFISSLILILLVFFSFYFLKRFYLHPLDSLVQTMEKVRDGQWNTTMEADYQTDEFVRMEKTFNEMMGEIQRLKIESYEQKLEIQQTNLEYLQIQIRPHFFLNCMKNLYALAQGKEYKRIQEMILVLSEHLRFLFLGNQKEIPVGTEMRNVNNYISLQSMWMKIPPVCKITVDPRLQGLCLPPLSLLTFVENSVKYGVDMGYALSIYIQISLLKNKEEEDYVSIIIRDNGVGFPEDILQKLNREEIESDGRHIGIQNVCGRFRLLYGDKCTFLFSNRKGAEIEIFFPYEMRPENPSDTRLEV